MMILILHRQQESRTKLLRLLLLAMTMSTAGVRPSLSYSRMISLCIAWLGFAGVAAAFGVGVPPKATRHCLPTKLSAGVDDMRKLLEASWNVEIMGDVPSSAEGAAESAALCVHNALDQQASKILLIDILLPQYDVSQGENLYDEVLSVEFCIALSKKVKGKSCIVVDNDKTIRSVSRILDRREEESFVELDEEDDDDEDEDDDEEEEDGVEFYDDFADFGSVGLVDVAMPKETVDSFREKLKAEWTKSPAEGKSEASSSPKGATKDAKVPQPRVSTKRHRLCSMLGDSEISLGADMQRAVVEAVKANGLPTDDEETLIILSPASPQELIGLRGLVRKYQSSKTIILVNCRLDPLPRELIKARTVYSILPLIAKSVEVEGNPLATPPKKDESPPKVVVLRRFPRDWEVFVDTGSGFELAETAPSGTVMQRGPSMQWIAGAVKRYLQSRA
jgi:hypothetical protein